MSTIYSGWSDGWKPSGANESRHYRARLDYWVSAETNTTITYSAILYVNLDYSVTVEKTPYQGYLDIGGSAWSGTCKTEYGGDKTVTIISTKSTTFTKTTSPQTVTIYGWIYNTTGDWDGIKTQATATITIPVRSYSVTFNANSVNAVGVPSAQSKLHGVDLVITSAYPSLIDNDFISWNTESDGTGTTFLPSGSFSIDEDTTLYAQWHLSFVPPVVTELRAYRTVDGSSGYNPNVSSTGLKSYADFAYVAPVASSTVSIEVTFGDEQITTISSDGNKRFAYSSDSHLPVTSKETVVVSIQGTDYKGNTYSYEYSTFISTENYVWDAFKGTSGSEEYGSFSIGGRARDFEDSQRHEKGNFDCYMNPTFYTMAGEIKLWAGATIPNGWLVCDGSEISKTTYHNLYAAIGDLWGVASQMNLFKLPDLKGRTVVGFDPNDSDIEENFALGSYGGARGAWKHNHTMASAGNHTHRVKYDANNSGSGSQDLYGTARSQLNSGGVEAAGAHTHTINADGSTNNQLPVNKANMPPYAVIKYIICAI